MLELRDVSFSYTQENPCVEELSLQLAPGERLVLVGANGSGKSTVARLANGGLLAASGQVCVDGIDPAASGEQRMELARHVGYVRQDPTGQLVDSKVFDEVAFGPCNLGLSPEEIRSRVAHALARVGLEGNEEREVDILSGGNQQLLALAGVLAMEPSYLILDEVCSYLDEVSHRRIRMLVSELCADGMGVLEISHDVDDLLDADRIALMDAGRILWQGSAQDFFCQDELVHAALLFPSQKCMVAQLSAQAGYPVCDLDDIGRLSLFLREAGLVDRCKRILLGVERTDPTAPSASGEAQEAHDEAYSAYFQDIARTGEGGTARRAKSLALDRARARIGDTNILYGCSMEVRPGSLTLLAGLTGAGKSTCCKVLSGVFPLDGGRALLGDAPVHAGDVGLVMQRPEEQFFRETVAQEVSFAPREQGLDEAAAMERAHRAMRISDIPEDLEDRSPFMLSGGQARRVAIAGIVAMDADAYVFDEPTAGLDGRGRASVQRIVRSLADAGRAVVVVSHNLGEWIPLVDDVILLREGHVSWTGSAQELRRDASPMVQAGLIRPFQMELAKRLDMEPQASDQHASESCEERREDNRTFSRVPRQRSHRTQDPVSALDVRIKLLGLILATIVVFAASSPVVLGLAALVLAALLWASGTAAADVVRALKPAAIVLGFSLLANSFAVGNRADLILLGNVGLSYAGIMRGFTAVARIVILLGFAIVVSRTTSSADLAKACTWLIRPLASLGLNVDEAGQVLATAIRFIGLANGKFDDIFTAQRARGLDFSAGSLPQRLGKWINVLAPLVVVLFRNADEVASAMRDRAWGYTERTWL